MARSFAFTSFDLQEAYDLTQWGKMKYIVIGQEKCPDTGRTHYQGYIELDSKQRLSALKKVAPTTHFEPRRGTPKQASDYCKKDGDFIEYGEISKQGKRSDIEEVKEILDTTGKMEDVMDRSRSYQASKFGEMYLKYKEPKRNWKPYVIWLWGPHGCGKSRRAEELCPNAYVKNESSKWWDGYDAHEEVIIDDFRDSMMPITDMLTLIDRYQRRVEHKGGSRQFLAKKIVITSIMKPDECYTHAKGEPIGQLLRRIDEIICVAPRPKTEFDIDFDTE